MIERRMKHLVKVLSLLLIIGVCSCVNRFPEYDARLVAAHELLKCDADSAFKVLSQMNVNDFKAEHDRAYYAYNYTVAQYFLDNHVTSDSLIKIAIDFYADSRDSVMKSKVFTYAAQIYGSMNKKEEAVGYYNKALDAVPEDSVSLKLKIYTLWAFWQNADNPNEESLMLFDKVKKLANEDNNKPLVVEAYIQQGWNYVSNGKYGLAIRHYQEALRITEAESLEYNMFSILNKLAESYAHKNENDTALLYAERALKYVNTNTHKRYINYTLCKIFINLARWDEADSCLAEAKMDFKDNAWKTRYYELLSRIKHGKGEYKEASECYGKYVASQDSFYKELIKNNSAEFQKKYDLTKVKLENSELKVKSQSQRMIIIYLVLVFILCGMAISCYMYYKSKKVKAKIQAKDEVIAEMVVTLQNEVNEKHLMREELADKESLIMENDRRERELRETLHEKDSLLQDVRDQRQLLKDQILEMNDVVKKIRKMAMMKTEDVSRKNAVLKKDEIELLFKSVDYCRNYLISRLRASHPELTTDELCLCCLLSLNISSPKIALLMDVSEDTLRQRKSRLRRGKLGLGDDVLLEDYLAELAQDEKVVSVAPGLHIDSSCWGVL